MKKKWIQSDTTGGIETHSETFRRKKKLIMCIKVNYWEQVILGEDFVFSVYFDW